MDPRPVRPLGGDNDNPLKKFWNESSRREKAFCVGSIIAVFCFISYWTLRVLVGWYFLVVYYIRAARGTGLASLACHRVNREARPFSKLSNKDWFLLQRCKGADWGFDRHDELLPSPREVIAYFTLRSGFSPILVSLQAFAFKNAC